MRFQLIGPAIGDLLRSATPIEITSVAPSVAPAADETDA
jgi:hypothetical protein